MYAETKISNTINKMFPNALLIQHTGKAKRYDGKHSIKLMLKHNNLIHYI